MAKRKLGHYFTAEIEFDPTDRLEAGKKTTHVVTVRTSTAPMVDEPLVDIEVTWSDSQVSSADGQQRSACQAVENEWRRGFGRGAGVHRAMEFRTELYRRRSDPLAPREVEIAAVISVVHEEPVPMTVALKLPRSAFSAP